METITQDHLDKADSNRDLAIALLTANLGASTYDWVAVISFYATVHYIHAHLWENHAPRSAPHSHKVRLKEMKRDPALMAIAGAYLTLSSNAHLARYIEDGHISQLTAQDAVRDMLSIEMCVRSLV